jgi:hypothetical protein
MLDYALKIAQSGTIALTPTASSGFRSGVLNVHLKGREFFVDHGLGHLTERGRVRRFAR